MAAELTAALNDGLPPPNEYQYKFSAIFEEKIQSLIRDRGTTYCKVAIQDYVIHK